MKSQYQSIDEVIEIEENSENNFSWRLIENFGSIEFTIKPINADLFINKEKRDFSNPVRLAPGSYIIEVKSNRHHDLKETIMINLGDNIEKFYELQPKFGNLYLNTIPSNAQVEIITNGETIDNFIGSNRINDILIGEYVLRVTAEGYKSKEYEIFINENEFLNLNIELIEGIDDTETKATSKSLIVPDSMVLVKGDMFHFNDDHQIRMGDFLIGKYEVTQEEWLEIMEYNNSKVKQEKLPVDNVNWYEAIVFCNKKSIRDSLEPVYRIGNRASTDPAWWGQIPINFDEKWNNVFVNWDANGYRIPTEAEWEYAAKGGHKSMFFKFSGSNDVSEVAWHRGNSSKESNIVGSKKPNELGVYDMSGNLYEWCWGWYGSLKKSLANNLKGSSKGKYRVIRGGCWFSSSGYCKVTKREEKEPWIRDNYTGFRYVRTIK